MNAVGLSQDTVWKLIVEEMNRQGFRVENEPSSVIVTSQNGTMRAEFGELEDKKVTIMFPVIKRCEDRFTDCYRDKVEAQMVKLDHQCSDCYCLVNETDSFCPNCGNEFKESN